MMRPCVDCGELATSTRCDECRLPDTKGSAHSRGYDAAWARLSVRARKLQPFCSDCLATDDLTVDHSPEAWARKAAGKRIRLVDVEVVCRSCNGKRGRARPTPGPGARTEDAMTRGGDPSETLQRPTGYTKFASHMRPILNKDGGCW